VGTPLGSGYDRCVRWLCVLATLSACQSPTGTAGSVPSSTAEASSEASTSGSTSVDPSGGSSSADEGIASGEGEGGGTSAGPDDLPRYLQYIRAAPYPRLVVEVDHVEGRAPYPVAIDGIERVFGEVLDKPGGVEVVLDDVLRAAAEPDPGWTADAMRELARETFDLEVPDDTVKIHVLVLDGHAAGEGSTIYGLAWNNLNIVLFRDLYDAACKDALLGSLQQPLCEQTEFLVWQHEVGHVIGLVDAGLPMVVDHRSPDDGPHDVDPNCVMYAEYDGSDAVLALVDRLVAGDPPIELDQHCLDDIEAAK
jgi:hypothetical protein